MVRDRHSPKLNGADYLGDKSMSSKRAYNGNCRMIEIGSGGIPFRYTVNVDKIDSIRFEERTQEIDVPVPGDEGHAEIRDSDDKILQTAIPPRTQKQTIGVGWTVVVITSGQNNGINFSDVQSAIACYNSIMGMIQAVGVPTVFLRPLKVPEMSEDSVDPEKIKEAVDAADLHPDLAGGEGDGSAENDDIPVGDDEFELTDEDLALLENPEIDVEGMEDVFADPEDPPEPN